MKPEEVASLVDELRANKSFPSSLYTDAAEALTTQQATIDELTPWKEKGMSLVSALQDNSSGGVNRAEAIIAELGVLALKQECQHDWIDPSNKHVVAGDWKLCSICGVLQEKT